MTKIRTIYTRLLVVALACWATGAPLQGPATGAADCHAACEPCSGRQYAGTARRRRLTSALASAAFHPARAQRPDRDAPFTAGQHLSAQPRAFRADRRPIPDHSGDRPAAYRRAAADRGRSAGRGLGCRGRIDARQGPLDSCAEHWIRLHSPRRRRPGLQQGHPDYPEHELLLCRCRPVG